MAASPWFFLLYLITAALCDLDYSDQVDSQGNLPLCSGDNDLNAVPCFRIDPAVPDSVCTLRDPDSQRCLQTETVQSKSTSCPSRDPVTDQCLQTSVSDPNTFQPHFSTMCDGQDPLCILNSNLDTPIDWSRVDGAEFLSRQPSGKDSGLIYVDSSKGSDESGIGSFLRPFRSLRAALSQWLQPGKCWPFCSSISPGKCGKIIVRPGDYQGIRNQNIDLYLFDGSNVTIQSDGTQGITGPYVRASGVDIYTAGLRSYFLHIQGNGQLALLGLNLINSSSEALLLPPTGIVLVTDLFFPHGRYGTWMQTIDVNGSVTRQPTWDVESDERVRDKVVACDGAAGCRPVGQRPNYDPLYYGPAPESRTPCESCFRLPAQQGHAGGLAVAVANVGTGCKVGGTLVAVGQGPGAGFSGTFVVVNGTIASVSVADYGAGYIDPSAWKIVMDQGGSGCQGVVFTPYIVNNPPYDFLFTPAGTPP